MTRPRFQFSIRWILIAIAAVAVWFGLWVADPGIESSTTGGGGGWPHGATSVTWLLGTAVTVLSLSLPPLCLVAFLRATGHARAFLLGIAFILTISAILHFVVMGSYSWFGGESVSDQFARFLFFSAQKRQFLLLLSAFAPVVGLLCAGFHWLLKRGDSPDND